MKRFFPLVLALIMCLSVSSIALAEDIQPIVAINSPGADSDSPARAEETTWYFRVVNGRTQMRLWSLTYRKWLTDWIDIGPAP